MLSAPPSFPTIRQAVSGDLEELLRLEKACFATDRLSRRSFRRWLAHKDSVFMVAAADKGLEAYILVSLRRGTRLARLYSLAVDPGSRGRGLAARLIAGAEQAACSNGALYMRLEVASDNDGAIRTYTRAGYKPFGLYRDYYEDHGDAVRMEKCIHDFQPGGAQRQIPWLAQSTEFTCGPASLMMAMTALDSAYQPSHREEIRLWRESTTVFMTSGHGGCHPLGLAIASTRRGFTAEVWISQEGPLFLEGVRDPMKKRVMEEVHESFVEDAESASIPIHYEMLDQQYLVDRFSEGANILILISTYRMNQKKAPHWVVVSGFDESCLYVHDPDFKMDARTDIEGEARLAMDCQHLPIAREDFQAMRRYGGSRLQAAVILSGGSRR